VSLAQLEPSAIINSTPPSFELTPLSGLIQQSFNDIDTLRAAHKGRGVVEEANPGRMIDFDKVEANLRKFEEVYRAVSVFS
jgi:hypothetical protein